jgi:hypothetical protein
MTSLTCRDKHALENFLWSIKELKKSNKNDFDSNYLDGFVRAMVSSLCCSDNVDLYIRVSKLEDKIKYKSLKRRLP